MRTGEEEKVARPKFSKRRRSELLRRVADILTLAGNILGVYWKSQIWDDCSSLQMFEAIPNLGELECQHQALFIRIHILQSHLDLATSKAK